MKKLFNKLSDIYPLFTEQRFVYHEVPKGNDPVEKIQGTQQTNKESKFADKNAENQAKTDLRNENEGKSYYEQIKRGIKDKGLADRINSTGEKILADKTNPDRFKQYRDLMNEVHGSYFLAKARAMHKARTEGGESAKVLDSDYMPSIEKSISKYDGQIASRKDAAKKEQFSKLSRQDFNRR